LTRPSGLSEKEYALFGRPLILTVAITLGFGWVVPGIDNWAHIFGLLAGAAVGWFLSTNRQHVDEARAGLLRSSLIIALTTVCLAASATINRYPVLRRVGTLIQEGEESLARGDRVRALSDFREAERLEPADYRPHLKLCSIYSAIGEARQAREEFEWAGRLMPRGRAQFEGQDISHEHGVE
jgi:tetratricopeptide (TPR) repeat protein